MRKIYKYIFILAAIAAVVLTAHTNVGLEAGSFIGMVRKPPAPVITVDGKRIPVTLGTYSWRWFTTGVCADSPSPYDIYKLHEKDGTINKILAQAAPGAQVKIDFCCPPYESGINSWAGNNAQKIEGMAFKLPGEKGTYIYDIWARWTRGSGSFAFYIEVK